MATKLKAKHGGKRTPSQTRYTNEQRWKKHKATRARRRARNLEQAAKRRTQLLEHAKVVLFITQHPHAANWSYSHLRRVCNV